MKGNSFLYCYVRICFYISVYLIIGTALLSIKMKHKGENVALICEKKDENRFT